MIVERRYRNHEDHLNIPAKANRILNIILISMLLIVLRVWHLAVVQYDEKLEESRKPQRHIVLEPAKRATIRDRFNVPLAINKVQYNASILYSQIKQIKSVAWETDAEGKRVKRYVRKEYITALSNLLARELSLDAERLEDLIYAKASLYNQIPFVIKEDLSEAEFYRLKMLEKDWAGIHVRRVPQRFYTHGPVAGDIVGYMGAINKQEYEGVISEIKGLEEFIESHNAGEGPPLPGGMASLEEVRKRLKDLTEQAYSVNDSIGKGGVEGRYEGILKGYRGKKSYYSDAWGNFLRELPGTREPLSGKRVLLTISMELQKYAEELLIQNEKIRLTRLSHLGPVKQTILAQKQPWIKGGAIIAMDPNNGEILAMASHPRFDPNDFIFSGETEKSGKKKSNVQKWLESESYLAEIWDHRRPLEREIYDEVEKEADVEEAPMSWDRYLDFVLAIDSPLNNGVLRTGTVKDAVFVQKNVEGLFQLSPKKDAYSLFNGIYQREGYVPHGKQLSISDREGMQEVLTRCNDEVQLYKRALYSYLGSLNRCYDQVLLVDLLRVAVPAERFSDELLDLVGNQSLSDYRDASAAIVSIQETVKKMSKDLFHSIDFKQWRQSNEKAFLKTKRLEEKMMKRYVRPYIDYLDAREAELFQEFWNENRWTLIAVFLTGHFHDSITETLTPYVEHFQSWHREISSGAHQEIEWAKPYQILKMHIGELPGRYAVEYMQTLRGFRELDRPLLGRYRQLRKNDNNVQLEKHLAAGFYPKFGYGYGRSQAYRQAATQGSIFKLITAYEAMVQRYRKLKEAGLETADLNPLEMVDQVYYHGKDLFVGYHTDGKPLPRFYKGGRLPRSIKTSIGRTDVLKALEMSSNPYFALIAGEVLDSPEDLVKAAKSFSYGSRTGLDLPGEIPGSVPTDLATNRTGVYSFAIGQHTLVVTPLQTSVMLSALANGGSILKPKIVGMTVGREPKRGKDLVAEYPDFPHQESLGLVGIDFPLFFSTEKEERQSLVTRIPKEVRSQVFLPDEIRRILLDGMCRVVIQSHGGSLFSLSRLYAACPKAMSDYVEMKHQLIGKTSTSESIENIDLDLEEGTNLYTHVWFGGIAYEDDVLDDRFHRFVYRDSFGHPELVVVVYLRYGGYGKEAAPVAAEVAKKWKEIKPRVTLDP